MNHLQGAYNGDTVPERFASIVAPHLQSFNYFLTHGMSNVVAGLEPFEVGILCVIACALAWIHVAFEGMLHYPLPVDVHQHHQTQFTIKRAEAVHSLRAWFENIRYQKPKGSNGERMWPTECRQAVRADMHACHPLHSMYILTHIPSTSPPPPRSHHFPRVVPTEVPSLPSCSSLWKTTPPSRWMCVWAASPSWCAVWHAGRRGSTAKHSSSKRKRPMRWVGISYATALSASFVWSSCKNATMWYGVMTVVIGVGGDRDGIVMGGC